MSALVGRLGLAVASAALMVLAAPTFDAWPLMWVALLPFLHLTLTSETPRRAFLWGWLVGTIANTAAFSWMVGLLVRFGHIPVAGAVPITLLLTAYQGLEFALLGWGVHRIHGRFAGLPMALVAPLVMVAIELLTPQIFPFYLAITQAWVLPVIQIAELTGPVGVTFVLVAANGALWDVLAAWRAGELRRARRPVVGVVAIVALTLVYGGVRIHQVDARRAAAPRATAGMVQANVGIQEKWDPRESARLLALHQRLSLDLVRRGADFIVWPESSYPYALPRDMDRDFPVEDPRRVARGLDRPLIFGAVTRAARLATPADKWPYNTALIMDGDGRITGKFDKVFLMLFGEYIPFYDSIPWFTDIFSEASNFSRGSEPAWFPLRLRGESYRVGPLICYEDILPAFTRRVAAFGPNLFVNITNDAWFGRTAEPYQHLALAVFRSVEHRLDMLRAVNTGVTAHIDAVGRVRKTLPSVDPAAEPRPAPATLLADVALLEAGGLYGKVGELFGAFCLGALAVLLTPRRWLRRLVRRRPG